MTTQTITPLCQRMTEDMNTRKLGRPITLVRQLAPGLGPQLADREGAAISIFTSLINTLQRARAVDNAELSDRILAANAARAFAQPLTT